MIIASVAALVGWLIFLFAYLHSQKIGAAGLFPSDLPFTDFYLYKPTFEVLHTPAFFQPNEARSGFAYPPAMAPLYRLFYLQHHRFAWYLLLTLLLWAALLCWVLREYNMAPASPRRRLTLLLSPALCYPAIFLLERGNLEVFVWAAVAAGIFLAVRGRDKGGALCFGLAAALKLYPIVLLGLFLRRRHWPGLVLLGLSTTAVATVAAIAYTGPTVGMAAQGFLHGITGFQQHYGTTVRPFELRFDHSLFAIVKVYSGRRARSPASLSSFYYGFCALLFSLLFFWRALRLHWLNTLLFLLVAMILLPPVSYEYTLVHLYVPALLLLALALRRRLLTSGKLACIGLLALFLPGDLLGVSSWFQPGQIQSLLLVFVAGCACWPLAQPPARQEG